MPSIFNLCLTFLRIGATTFGGMWAATRQLENELVHRKAWLSAQDQQTLMVAATLIPAPRFLAFGALVGFRLRGWAGAVVSLVALVTPAALFVLLGVMVLHPDVIGAPLVPVQRAVGITIVGLLFGNSYHQLKSAKLTGRQRLIGISLALAVGGAAAAGVSLLIAAIVGLAVGAVLIQRDERAAN